MTTTRPFILLTNDDGIQAAGIKHLWDAVYEFADVAIVAPHTEKSGSGLAITSTKPLTVREYPWENHTPAFSINGTPADCVKMALSVIFQKTPTLILSGVNRGSNAGRTLLYSGTVGGVMEGAMRNIPGIAFSFSEPQFPPLGSVKKYLSAIVRHFLANPLPQSALLNATLPDHCEQGIQGIRMAKQGKSYWIEKPEKRLHPEGSTYYWLGGQWSTHDEEAGSDVDLLKKGYLTIVPISIENLTDHRLFDTHQKWVSDISC